jgi:hypothetical protein
VWCRQIENILNSNLSPLRRSMLAVLLSLCGLAAAARADEFSQRITFLDDKQQPRSVEGKIVTEAQDGGLLLLGGDGRLWTITPEQLSKREATTAEFRPLAAAALAKQVQAELGPGFEVITTPHYVVCANTSKAYAQWCGALFERLYTAFHSHWKQRDVKLHPPEFPLVAVILADETQFAKFAQQDVGPAAASSKGYFSIPKNRMVLYDLTATEGRTNSPAEIERRLEAAPFNIATVVHEATHQIAFNSGLHTRFADNPVWLTEGMAMYFETPDLRSKTGWKTVGALNRARLRQFQEYAAKRRKSDSLSSLLASDVRFTAAETAGDAYAEAWALSYFLIKTKTKAYTAYLEQIAEKPPLVWNTPDERLAEFRAAFGDDLAAFDQEFVRYAKRFR